MRTCFCTAPSIAKPPAQTVHVINIALQTPAKMDSIKIPPTMSEGTPGPSEQQGTRLVNLERGHRDFIMCEQAMQNSIANHGLLSPGTGGIFSQYDIIRVQEVENAELWEKYEHRREEVAKENANFGCHGTNPANERMLFHGSSNIKEIVERGFDERYAKISGIFGAGIYFAPHSSKANQYVFGMLGGTGCKNHHKKSCYICERQLLYCLVTLGNPAVHTVPKILVAHAPPGYHSVYGKPSLPFTFPEYVVYRGEQAFPKYLITYKIVK